MHGNAQSDGLGLGRPRFPVVAKIGFGQNDDWGGAALPGSGQVAFDPPRVEIRVQRRHQERYIHIRGNDLRRGATSDRFALEGATARKEMLNGGGRLVGTHCGGHPVTGDRISAGFGLMGESPG